MVSKNSQNPMIPFSYTQPYASRRSPMMGLRGAVATSQPLAAQAGMRMLQAGGNAVDAAIAAAIALTVVEPTSNGLGSDAFALIWDGKKIHGLNASGKSPAQLDAHKIRKEGLSQMPIAGWLPVTVPGAVSAWVEMAAKFGSLPLTEIVKPALEYAENGYPVPPVIAGYWRASERRFAGNADFARVFLPNGHAPAPGTIFRFPEVARTLRSIAESAGEEFYRGALAREIVAHSEKTGGYLTLEDFNSHRPEWVEPISTNYRGYDILEIPPNGQGITALIALNILEGWEQARLPQLSSQRLHLVIEALKYAFADVHAYVADPRATEVPTAALLSKDYAATRRREIDPVKASTDLKPGLPGSSDTVYLCTADGNGMMVSFIQSNYMGFGSGIVVPGTGISLQNRGAGFSLTPGHPNEYAPGKRPYHTIIPGFIMKDGTPLSAFGVMGGDMQPQGHLQVVSGIVDYGLNPQAAIDCPRVRVLDDHKVEVEAGIAPEAVRELARMGHRVIYSAEMAGFGGGQMIWRDPESGVLIAGSEPRKDGQAVVF